MQQYREMFTGDVVCNKCVFSPYNVLILSGESVALSSDGATMVVATKSSSNAGNPAGSFSAYELVGTVWTQFGSTTTSTNDNSVFVVSLSEDGRTVAIGSEPDLSGCTTCYPAGTNGCSCTANCESRVKVYTYGASWSQKGSDLALCLPGFGSKFL